MSFGNMGKMMQQIQQMQRKMEEMQEKVQSQSVEAQAGGGVVRVTVSGALELLDLEISPEAIDPDDVEMLQDLVIAAVNEGFREAQEMVRKEMEKVTGGLNLPNIPGLM